MQDRYEQRRLARNRRRYQKQQRRRTRWIVGGVFFAVLCLLAAKVFIGRLANTSIATGEYEQRSAVQSASEQTISTEFSSSESTDSSTDGLAPRTQKLQVEGYTDVLDCVLQTTGEAFLYERDSTGSHVVTTLPEGTYVETYGTEGQWTKVTSMGRAGYMQNRVLRVVQDAHLFHVVDGHLIVNKKYGLPLDYETVTNSSMQAALTIMREAMEREGIQVEVASLYRSAKEEQKEFVLQGSPKNAPEPGHSVLQTGCGVQFYAPGTDPRINRGFEETPAYQWLRTHAFEYGFVQRYPEGSETVTGYRVDPTIFFYIGREDASIIRNEALTLETFYGVE